VSCVSEHGCVLELGQCEEDKQRKPSSEAKHKQAGVNSVLPQLGDTTICMPDLPEAFALHYSF
jgi:hypothetical protein